MIKSLKIQKFFILLGSICTVYFHEAPADDTKNPFEDRVLGDFLGKRSQLYDKGIDILLEYKGDYWNVSSGGIKTGNNYNDNTDLKFGIDGEKLFGIKGNKAYFYFINNNGGKPNANRIGSTQGIDNIEVSTNTFKLYEAWIDQSFFNDKLSVLVGLHDLNSEFVQTDLSNNFIKPVFQVPQTIAQSGENGPSIFPNTSVALRLKYTPSQTSYASVAVFDGVPGNVNRPHGTHIDFQHGDGLLLIAEAGITSNLIADKEGTPNKFAIGGWIYSEKMPDLVDATLKKNMEGIYFLSSYQIYYNKEANKTIGIFLRGGVSDGNTANIDFDYETGIVANGWVPGRPEDEIGLALAQAHNSDAFLQENSGYAHNEYSFELYYRDKIINGIALQPDLQYIINPGTQPGLADATVAGLRVDINF